MNSGRSGKARSRSTAGAIARAALAAHATDIAGAEQQRPRAVLAAAAGPVPRRVTALLRREPKETPRRAGRRLLLATALLTCLALSAGSALDAAADLHGSIEMAQGEAGQH